MICWQRCRKSVQRLHDGGYGLRGVHAKNHDLLVLALMSHAAVRRDGHLCAPICLQLYSGV